MVSVIGTCVLFSLISCVISQSPLGYICQGNEVLVVHSKTVNYVKMHCGIPRICGDTRTCAISSSAGVCNGKASYLMGVNKNIDKSIFASCCQYGPPVKAHLNDDCYTQDVVDKLSTAVTDQQSSGTDQQAPALPSRLAIPNGSLAKPVSGLVKPSGVDSLLSGKVLPNANSVKEVINEGLGSFLPKGNPVGQFVDKNFFPKDVPNVAASNLTARADLSLFKLTNRQFAVEVVKGIERIPNGYRITSCFIECDPKAFEPVSSTETPLQTTTHSPSSIVTVGTLSTSTVTVGTVAVTDKFKLSTVIVTDPTGLSTLKPEPVACRPLSLELIAVINRIKSSNAGLAKVAAFQEPGSYCSGPRDSTCLQRCLSVLQSRFKNATCQPETNNCLCKQDSDPVNFDRNLNALGFDLNDPNCTQTTTDKLVSGSNGLTTGSTLSSNGTPFHSTSTQSTTHSSTSQASSTSTQASTHSTSTRIPLHTITSTLVPSSTHPSIASSTSTNVPSSTHPSISSSHATSTVIPLLISSSQSPLGSSSPHGKAARFDTTEGATPQGKGKETTTPAPPTSNDMPAGKNGCSSVGAKTDYKTSSCISRCSGIGPDGNCGQKPDKQVTEIKGATTNNGPGGCFSADMLVHTKNGTRRMDELQIGDEVLVVSDEEVKTYQPVEWFYHRDPQLVHTFISLITESGRRLSLTPNHLLVYVPCDKILISWTELDFYTSMNSKFARRLRIGQCVPAYRADGSIFADRVLSVEHVTKRGVYSPITAGGTVVVNDVHNSCYSTVESHVLQYTMFKFMMKVARIISSAMHMFGCHVTTAGSSASTYEIPPVLLYILEITKVVMPSSIY